MSKLKADHAFTSESVSEGHLDKICDQVSDAILDACRIHPQSADISQGVSEGERLFKEQEAGNQRTLQEIAEDDYLVNAA